MSWRKLFRRCLTVIFILASLLTAVVVAAAIQIFDGTGQYIMSDDGDREFGKKRAQQRAELDAQKKAGVYLTSFSRSVNANLTNDEISVVTNNIIKVSDVKIVPVPFETNGEAGLMYRVTLKASIDTEGIYDYIKRDSKEKVTIVQQNNGLQDAIAKNDALIEDLKEQYKRTTSQAERDRIIKQMNDADRDFLANQKLEEGNKLYYAKDYYGAIKLYRDALKLKPNWDWAYNNRGLCYDYLGQYERAIQDYNKAIELNPNGEYPYNNRGHAYYELGQYERAIKDYNQAISLNPNFADAYNNRGVTYMNGLKQYERAIQDFNNAIELNPNYAKAYNNRGVTYMNGLKQYERAIQDFNNAIELNPNYAKAYYNRGVAYSDLGQNERAIQDYNKAIELNPNFWQTYFNRGNAYWYLKKYKQAIESYTKAIQINPKFANAIYWRGMCYQELGEAEKAQADFAKAKELGYNG